MEVRPVVHNESVGGGGSSRAKIVFDVGNGTESFFSTSLQTAAALLNDASFSGTANKKQTKSRLIHDLPFIGNECFNIIQPTSGSTKQIESWNIS